MRDRTAGARHPNPTPAARPPAGTATGTSTGSAAVRLVRSSLAHSRGQAWRLTLWTLLSTAPALVSGKVLAIAVDQGFLAQRPRAAVLGLGVFAVCALVGAWASR